MTKETEELLFKTIEEALDYGASPGYSSFDFTELYKLIESLEEYKYMYESLK